MATVLSVRGLRKRYGKIEALKGIDLDVEEGEVFGFLGPNGAGKTTFTKCVTGFVSPAAGEVRIVGIDGLANRAQAAQHIGLVPDQYDFYPNLTGRQHLDFYGRLMDLPEAVRGPRIDEVLEMVRMTERADTRTKGYSHGMKQRICIAQAILHRPKLVFFDEPTNGLDPKGAYELRVLIKDLGRQGHTVFLNSHLLHEVEETCSRVAILDRGELKTVSRVDELRRRFAGAAETRIRVLRPTKKALVAAQSAATGRNAVIATDGSMLTVTGDEEAASDVVAALAGAGAGVVEVKPAQASLESVFLELTREGGTA